MSELANDVVMVLISLTAGAAAASWVWYFIILPLVQTHKMIKECRSEVLPQSKHDSKLKHV